MRVLAIDSSGLTATVGIVEDTQTIAEYTVNYKKTHSQTLLPMIDEMTRSFYPGCDRGGRRPRIIYRTEDRIGNCKGTWTGTEQTVDPCTDCRCTGL